MKSDRLVITKWKMHVYGLLVILLAQSMGIPLLIALLKEFTQPGILRNAVLSGVVAIFAAVDLYFLFNRIILLRYLLNKEPVKCKVEDVFLIGYKDDGKTRYAPFPIVRSLADNKLYLTYDKYSLLAFKSVFNYSDRRTATCALYKNDGTPVRIGDIADMYMLKPVRVRVSVNRLKNIVRLKGRKIHFRHMNSQNDIDIFEKVIFFKGAIDLDADIG